MTLTPNQQFRPARLTTREQRAAVQDSNKPSPMAPDIVTIADVELTVTVGGQLKYRDHKGIARRVDMTNDIQTSSIHWSKAVVKYLSKQ